jgi:hypothetical protein
MPLSIEPWSALLELNWSVEVCPTAIGEGLAVMEAVGAELLLLPDEEEDELLPPQLSSDSVAKNKTASSHRDFLIIDLDLLAWGHEMRHKDRHTAPRPALLLQIEPSIEGEITESASKILLGGCAAKP